MTLVELLARLEGVRPSGGQWIARCPAHEDRSPSLSVAAEGDRLLVHCYAGCRAEDVMGALGLGLSDLWEGERLRAPVDRRRMPTWSALRRELDILAMCADRREESASADFRRKFPQLVDAHPEQTFSREKLAARRVKALIEKLYHV